MPRRAERLLATDADWAALRRAAPGFRRWWAHYRTLAYDPALASVNIGELARWVAGLFRGHAATAGLRPLFAAVERMLAAGDEALDNLLVIGFFESLIMEHDDRWFDPRPLYRMLAGPRSRRAWRTAAAYVAPEARWHASRGFVRTVRYGTCRGEIAAFSAEHRPLAREVAVHGLLRSGEVREGWYLRYEVGPHFHANYRVAAVHRPAVKGWPQLVELSVRYRSQRERVGLGILEMIANEPASLLVYDQVPPRPESRSGDPA